MIILKNLVIAVSVVVARIQQVLSEVPILKYGTIRTEIIMDNARTSRISGFGLGRETQ